MPSTQTAPTHGLSIGALASCIVAGAASADLYVNSAQVQVQDLGARVAGAQYRLSNGAWDMGLDNGEGTGQSKNFVSSNLGNSNQLSSRTYAFSLTNLSGQGLIWTLTDTESGKVTTDAWGTFATKPDGTVKAVLDGVAPGASFNALSIEARATRAGSSMSFSDLAFNGEAIAHGAFAAGAVDPGSGGPDSPSGFWRQFIASTTDLSKSNWSFTGLLHGVRSGGGGDDDVHFAIGAHDATFSVPAPGAAALLAIAGFFSRAGIRRSRRA